jgi:hypothetical protein
MQVFDIAFCDIKRRTFEVAICDLKMATPLKTASTCGFPNYLPYYASDVCRNSRRSPMEALTTIPDEAIASRIYFIRGEKVMLDEDLAQLYEVPTKQLNQQVKRNPERFPQDFMFQLEENEWTSLRSQFVTSKGKGGRRTLPYAFTEHGVLMLSSVLNSERAIAVNIRIMRIFVRMNRLFMNDMELQMRLDQIEGRQDQTDAVVGQLFETVKKMMEKPSSARQRIGYKGGDPI